MKGEHEEGGRKVITFSEMFPYLFPKPKTIGDMFPSLTTSIESIQKNMASLVKPTVLDIANQFYASVQNWMAPIKSAFSDLEKMNRLIAQQYSFFLGQGFTNQLENLIPQFSLPLKNALDNWSNFWSIFAQRLEENLHELERDWELCRKFLGEELAETSYVLNLPFSELRRYLHSPEGRLLPAYIFLAASEDGDEETVRIAVTKYLGLKPSLFPELEPQDALHMLTNALFLVLKEEEAWKRARNLRAYLRVSVKRKAQNLLTEDNFWGYIDPEPKNTPPEDIEKVDRERRIIVPFHSFDENGEEASIEPEDPNSYLPFEHVLDEIETMQEIRRLPRWARRVIMSIPPEERIITPDGLLYNILSRDKDDLSPGEKAALNRLLHSVERGEYKDICKRYLEATDENYKVIWQSFQRKLRRRSLSS